VDKKAIMSIIAAIKVVPERKAGKKFYFVTG